mmetsp:Transcript_7127/g.17930  ORF Transcript_7127/g.17930 Transcript_7127/m.17930 type:complete len:213 (+) Transcript_7127:238-876(+)
MALAASLGRSSKPPWIRRRWTCTSRPWTWISRRPRTCSGCWMQMAPGRRSIRPQTISSRFLPNRSRTPWLGWWRPWAAQPTSPWLMHRAAPCACRRVQEAVTGTSGTRRSTPGTRHAGPHTATPHAGQRSRRCLSRPRPGPPAAEDRHMGRRTWCTRWATSTWSTRWSTSSKRQPPSLRSRSRPGPAPSGDEVGNLKKPRPGVEDGAPLECN